MSSVTLAPVSLSATLEAGAVTGTLLDGREIALWRDADGTAHAWEDRCPHRGMRMSFGFVRGNRIACLYHGWRYDTAGQCDYIPAHPDLDVPKTIRVTSYPLVEAAGIIWTAPDAGTLPEMPLDGVSALGLRSITVDLGAEAALALVAATPPPGAAASGLEPVDGLDAAWLGLDDGRLLVAVQRLLPERTTLHFSIESERNMTASRRIDLIGWTTALRLAAARSVGEAA